MKIARIISPIHALGPGNRVGLWVQGCTRNCSHCISPELQSFNISDMPEEAVVAALLQASALNGCKGLTISGGEPFEQPEALLKVLKGVRKSFSDILVYTGFKIEEILGGQCGECGRLALQYIDVLIDGPYEDTLNTSDCILRGSSNQMIHFLNGDIRDTYSEYMSQGRILETFVHNSNLIIVGIIDGRGAK